MGRIIKSYGHVLRSAQVVAHADATVIRATALEDAERMRNEVGLDRQEARRAGYEAGFTAGRQEGLASVTELLVRARADADSLRVGAQDSAVALARRMAEKIVGQAVHLAPSFLADMIVRALAETRARSGSVVVRLHPQDLETVSKERPRLAASVANGVDVKLTPDPGIERNGCIIDSPMGRMDARLSTQLDALERALFGRRS
jgi:flagellar assembly protein FliH